MSIMASQITRVSQLFAQPFVQAQIIKENIKALCHWPLLGESTSDWWIPLTKGQQGRKCFLFNCHMLAMFFKLIDITFFVSCKSYNIWQF